MAINEVMLDSMTYLRGARDAQEIVENWHNDKHIGQLEHCTEQPCHAISRRENSENLFPKAHS